MAERGAIAFEPKVEFPDNAFEAARMYLALMAYPELGEGQPGERGCRLTEAFWEYYMWNWRRVRGLREVRAALAAPRFNTPRQRRFEGAVERGRRRIMRRFAAFDIVGSQMVSAMFNANDIAYRMKSAGEDPFERSHTGGHATLRTDIWQRAMPSARRIIRNNLPGWSESFDLKESVVPADPIQKERDLVARGFVQSRPVIHMVHGINQILEDHEKDLYALGDADWLLVLLWNCEIWIWEAIEHAERWRILSGWTRMPMIAPDLMVELVSPKMCAKLPTATPESDLP
ncbi:hypothetical protein CVO77_12350 [Sphingopyxis lindanitolerans]|uniref:Uncharacterized protein n=1 Tax=Sphingopyxis lindanitolerans TaxID=2054227 RepID=A0A2S8B0V0_9SPHN|nr:hypothetical protein [Sphingopyxis lindanitolerans]PQM25899.1 hypothetical protein CVO77_12350 [Sphingopyxis lindanitolerans]